MPTYHVTVNGKEYTVEVPNLRQRPVRAIVDGEVIEVAIAPQMAAAETIPPEVTPTAAPAPTPQFTTAYAGSGTIAAPLPGVVVSIAVSEGDAVEWGQELCVLEAMKMNNPIRATQSGTVKEVFVRIGEQVQHGASLMTIEG